MIWSGYTVGDEPLYGTMLDDIADVTLDTVIGDAGKGGVAAG